MNVSMPLLPTHTLSCHVVSCRVGEQIFFLCDGRHAVVCPILTREHQNCHSDATLY